MILNNLTQARLVEADGFYHGMQGVSPDAALRELEANLTRQQEERRQTLTHSINQEAARLETLAERQPEAEKHWRRLEAQTGGMPPQIALPLLAVLSGALVVLGEGIFLAPVMDGFGISDAAQQSILAMVLVLTSSGLLKLAIHQLYPSMTTPSDPPGQEAKEQGPPVGHKKLPSASIAVVLSIFALAVVAVLGWWRAEEMIFAGSIGQGELGNFLGENKTLTRVCVTLLTLGLPILAAVAFEYGFDRLHLAWQWRRARQSFHSSSRKLHQARQRLEAVTEQAQRQIAALDQRKKEWTNAYLQSHELGRRVGAHQLPLWRVMVKIVAMTICILTLCLLFDPILANYISSAVTRGLLYACTTLGLGGLYCYHAIRAWDRPNPHELYKQRATLWRNGPQPEPYSREVQPNGVRRPVQLPCAIPEFSQANVTRDRYLTEGGSK